MFHTEQDQINWLAVAPICRIYGPGSMTEIFRLNFYHIFLILERKCDYQNGKVLKN